MITLARSFLTRSFFGCAGPLMAGVLAAGAAFAGNGDGLPAKPPGPPHGGAPMVQVPKIPDFKPKTPEERDMILADLYKKLATTEHKAVADAVAAAIEKLWIKTFSDTSVVLGRRAAKAVEAKNFELALQFQSILVELNPDFAQGWFARALTRVQTGDLQGARKDLQQTLVLEPNHYRAMAQLAFILHQAGEDKAALESIRKLKAVHPHFFSDAGAAEQGLKELEQKVEGRGI